MPKIVDFDRSPFGRDPHVAPLISGQGARSYYRVGYLDTARDTASALRKRDGTNESAMPVLYLFRHYVELALKDILAAGGAFAIDLADKKFGHNLAALWGEVAKVLNNFNFETTVGQHSVINELVELDARADAFRYALDKAERQQFERIGSVDLDSLLTAIEDLSKFFERVLDKLEEAEAEMDEMIEEAIARDPY